MHGSKVHFIAGKGGVGKTSVSRALASHFANSQKKTLLVTLSEEDSTYVEQKISAPSSTDSPYLKCITIFPDLTLYEYLSLKLPAKKMLDSVMAQSLFRALFRAMPGLADLTRLGKIWFHADEREKNSRDIYEKIVVDMPSTGFVARFLTIAKVVYEVVKIGPLAKEAKLIHDYFHNPKNARVHLVTMAEELIVNETIELFVDVKHSKSVSLGALFINRVLMLDKNFSVLSEHVSSYPHLHRIVDFFSNRHLREQKEIKRLEKDCQTMPQIIIADDGGETFEQNMLNSIKNGPL